MLTFSPDRSPGWLVGSIALLFLVLGMFSIFHAFRVRKEYLLRLEILQTKATEKEAESRRRLHAEMNQG